MVGLHGIIKSGRKMMSDIKSKFYEFLKSFGKVNTDKIEEDLQELVKNPAEIKKSHDFEQRITIEVIAEPWKLDAHDNWYSYDTIVKEAYPSFDKNWKEGNLSMNLFHEIDDPKGELVELVDHYIVPFDCIVPNPATGKDYEIKKGTWCAEVKWNHPALWKQRTEIIQKVDGTKGSLIGGLSLNGWGVVVKEEDVKDED